MARRRRVLAAFSFLGAAAAIACGSSTFSGGDTPGSDGGSNDATSGTETSTALDASSDGDADLPTLLPACPPLNHKHGVDTFASYDPANGNFTWSNCFGANFDDGLHVILDTFPYAFAGSWMGDGVDWPGVYDPTTATFRLIRPVDAGSDLIVSFGGAGGTTLPVAGDWNGDTYDTIGFYDVPTSTFFLNDANTSGGATYTVVFGTAKDAGTDLVPIVGDWDGDGKDTVGLYDPDLGKFYLRNVLLPGAADATFTFGAPHRVPLVGDWDGDQRSGVGTYDPATGLVELENVAGAVNADYRFTIDPGLNLVAGDWDGN